MKFEIQEISQKRNISKFAWLPVKVEQPYTGKKFIIWLDKYYESQIYLEASGYWFTKKRWIS